ncbi:nuclear pore complex protein NUP214 isoform X2 [Amaranthus tricolor]|uniref:nuclear pore complex protein NUP214 isoform X2 n=1 Tax=Amaranthus tricolor TaxID=29722 RepID=UPI00258C9AAA|nr:nuclear pore complex protein NUP214 isoform X2 [Amaranthus tricolor]
MQIGRSMDGSHVAVARKNNLSIFSPKFKEILQILLPIDKWTGDSDSIKVDSIKWVRSDSIVVGCFQKTEDGREENYFIQVITSKDGQIIDDSPKLASVDFDDLFPGIVDDVMPCGCGPYLLVNYLENCELAFVSNRKSTDDHIMLFNWPEGHNQVSIVEIVRDTWLPRILLQENGDENMVLGLCADELTVYEKVKVKIGLEEETELPPCCLLLCLTLEGKLVMFYVASTAVSQRSSQALSSAASNAQSISVVGPSNLEQSPLKLEEEITKRSTSDLKSHALDPKEISSALDEVPVKKDQKPSEQNKYTLGAPTFDHNIGKELLAAKNDLKAMVDANNSKPFEQAELSRKETSNLSSFKILQDSSSSFATGKGKIENVPSLSNNCPEKNPTSIGRGIEEKVGSDVFKCTPSHTTSGSSLGSSALYNEKSIFSSPVIGRSTLPGSPHTFTDKANSTGGFFGNFYSGKTAEKAANYSQQPISGVSSGTHPILGNDKKSSPFRQINFEQNIPKQFSNVENMTKELDKLLDSIEEIGGFRDACTTAHKSSLEALEVCMDRLSERNRIWQSFMEEQSKEIQQLLDQTVQVLARKTHMEGIVRQASDGQYWDLWNRQKLNLELDQKQRNIINRNQDLINQMIELEKHFNTLEMNIFGERSRVNLVSRALSAKSVPSRHQSLHAIHNATISQLAAAKQLSDSLSKQMAVLSIKSPTTKANVKKKVFDSIGLPYPDDSPHSPKTLQKLGSPPNRLQLGSCSGETRSGSRRIQLSGVSSQDLETARRRRDSLDRTWANFEALKTTVKRMVVQNERQKVGNLFGSVDKQFIGPQKLEESSPIYSKDFAVQTRNGCNDMPQKVNSDTAAATKFKWTGGTPELSQATEQPPRWKLFQENSFSAALNSSSSSSSSSSSLSYSSSSSSSVFADPNMKKENNFSTAERQGTQIGIRSGYSGTASVDTKSSALQFGEGKPQQFFFSMKDGQAQPSSSKDAKLTMSFGGQKNSDFSTSKQNAESSPSTVFPQISSTSSPNLNMQTLPVTSGTGFMTSTKLSTNVTKDVLQFPPSSFSVSSSFAAPLSAVASGDSKDVLECPTSAKSVSMSQMTPVISLSSKDDMTVKSDSTGSSINPFKEVSKTELQASATKLSVGNNQAITPESPKKLAPRFNTDLNSQLKSSSIEISKALASSSDMMNTVTPASVSVSNAPEKPSAAFISSPVSPSELEGAISGKGNGDATVADQDEMEEEAPETNQTTDLSLGSLSGFGLGSAPGNTAPRSNPFGGPITSAPQTMPSSISLTVPSGEFFRPASFSFQSLQASQPSQSANIGSLSGAFGFSNAQQISGGGGFGQPSQIGGSGQQALGSVLGSFGQSRQIGTVLPGSGFGVPQSLGGGFSGISSSGGSFAGGFATAASSGGGFASAAPIGGGFAAAASSGGGFASAATIGGGFGSVAPSVGGFPSAAPSGGSFAAAAGGAGGFSTFSKPGATGFSAFGGAAGGRPAPPELFTQMRK